ncbi:MAG: DUF4145 domain-containing protein [Alphaproteobacteria bacterium]
MAFNWTCSYCGNYTTIVDENLSVEWAALNANSSHGEGMALRVSSISCPNPECKRLTVAVILGQREWRSQISSWVILPNRQLLHTRLLPESSAIPLPDYVPAEIAANYKEACRILDLSPKASAALFRRCLQGIVRDFWDIPEGKRGNLGAELNFIKDKVDGETWDIIQGIRTIGDIGAHMDKNVDFIIDIEPHEAELLKELTETLFKSWYFERERKRERLGKLGALTNRVRNEQKAAKAALKEKPLEDES